ncbi:MAG: HD domain-containing protein [Lachnospiraceae bacterium]|nr:HD domain-containing protein [Lachnospiraceae bacterium]
MNVPYALFICVTSALLLVIVLLLIRLKKVRKRETCVLAMVTGCTEAGDPSLDGHSLNVMFLTMLLYDFLPTEYRIKLDREKLMFASLLLDLGKKSIPSSIRNKSGKLTDKEWKLMRQHPEIGSRIIASVPSLKGVGDLVLYHHERVDGGGYHKLKGEEIPLASRVIAVTDTFSAITMIRPYRPSLPYEEAIQELKLAAGTQLDSELVKYFCEIPPKRVNECLETVKKMMECYSHERIKE